MRSELDLAADFVQGKANEGPLVGLILGSGLGGYADGVQGARKIAYSDIPHFPAAAVAGHRGELVLGRIGSVGVACLSGRVHLYEGHDPERVVFGARLLAALGCRAVLVTNAAGGIREGLRPGGLLLLSDHVNLTGRSPLVGTNELPYPRFPDMTHAYDLRLRELAHETARAEGIALDEGVYAGVLGPSYETPAEVAMLAKLGADVVGMSTVHEAIALRHRGVRVGALSLVTNFAAGLSERPLDHAEVQAMGVLAREKLETLMTAWLQRARSALTSES